MADRSTPTPPPAVELPEDPDDYVNAFAAVPGRARADGWTVERQRGFVAALRECGVIALAASSVGKTHQSAYKLRARPGAASFAEAWDRALREARSDALAEALQLIENGRHDPRFYRGQFIRMERRNDYRLLIAALRASHARPPAKGDQ